MKLPLKEPIFAKYLYVGPNNVVHVLMPVVSGTRIGLDNTCKAVFALQEFFGKGTNSNQKATLKGELLAYQEALESDLSLLKKDTLLAQQKQERLTQIKAYLAVINKLEKHPELNCLNAGLPSYPRPLETLMQDRTTSNLYSMVLRPTNEDGYLRSEAANPIFSVAHKSVARNRDTTVSPLQQELIAAYRPLSYEAKDSKSQVIQQVLAQLQPIRRPVSFEQLREVLQQTVEALLNVPADFSKTQQGEPINQQDIDAAMGFDPRTTTNEEYIEALLGYCSLDLFDTVVDSPFNTLIQAEQWSVATQFLLGIANIYCVSQGKLSVDSNWGQILDSNAVLSKNLAETLAKAQQENRNIEEACLSWINAHAKELKLTVLTSVDMKAIKTIFAERYAEIKDSPHFDEFFLLDANKKGNFFIHQGAICTPFAKFASSPLFDLPPNLTQPLKKACHTANQLSTEIPNKNPLVQGEIEVDTRSLDDTTLQALYERINGYKDQSLKKQLFAQLKQERPDFKLQIDAKQFLQHIAYGEQDEAEALLQKDQELAQELLRANNIPFTDYSGRTFTCTAYEYAYWAKDAHMLKMLEKYIKQDEETRQFILERVNIIEELVKPRGISGFFKHAKPRGLHYTTQDKQGKTIDHWEAHFDLTPLEKALQAYSDAYDKSPKRSEADWEALNEIWIKVGLLQREVPAHIAQEYCNPDRSFFNIAQNPTLLDVSSPDNLKRQLKFYNRGTGNHDVWFTRDRDSSHSGLGISFAILRWDFGMSEAVRGARGGWECLGVCGPVRIDLAAIKAIDEGVTSN